MRRRMRRCLGAALPSEHVTEDATCCGGASGPAVVVGAALGDGGVLCLFAVPDRVHPAKEAIGALAHAAAEEDERDQEEGAEDTADDAADLRGGEASGGGVGADDAAEAEVGVVVVVGGWGGGFEPDAGGCDDAVDGCAGGLLAG